MRKVHTRFAEFRWTNRVVWSSLAMFLTSAKYHLFEKRWCESKIGMQICILHFASSLLRIFLAALSFLEFLYGILLMLSRCCFHHIVDNSILYKKDIQHFCIGPILFSENKIKRSVVGGKVDGQILSGTRSEKPKILSGTRDEKRKNLFATKWQFRKILFGSQRVKMLTSLKWRKVGKKYVGVFCWFCHLPSNGVIMKIVLSDLDLLFWRSTILNVNISDMVKASAKMHKMTFIDFNFCQWLMPLRKLHLMTLTYFFKVKIRKYISWKQRASADMWNDFKYLVL